MSDGKASGGLVVLTGAGPGPAELVTLAGANWLSRADVVVYDRLVGRELLRLAPPEAELVDVGKAAGGAGAEQRSINDLLVSRARSGKLVVRLKGGDPLVFARGGEEAEALAAAGVPYRVVAGVTAATAAAASAGIPLTHRRLASAVALVTGHEDPGKDRRRLNWQALAGIDTVVFYMGVGNLPEIVRRLIDAGRDPHTPAAIVALAATPRQRTLTARLVDLPAEAAAANIAPPALTIVGEVVSLREKLAWFEHLPLFGQTVLVTRPAHQAGGLTAGLRELGAAVVESPAIEVLPPADFAPVEGALRRLGTFDLVVFTSVNGVEAFVAGCRRVRLDGRALGGAKVAAVGPATADALRGNFIYPEVVPATHTTEALAAELTSTGGLGGKRALLVRADIAPDTLRRRLGDAGAEVEEVAFYRVARPRGLSEEALAALDERRVDWITFTSSSAVNNLLALLEGRPHADLTGVSLAAIGPVTAQTLRSHGLEPTAVAGEHTAAGLVQAIARAVAGRDAT